MKLICRERKNTEYSHECRTKGLHACKDYLDIATPNQRKGKSGGRGGGKHVSEKLGETPLGHGVG